MATIQTPNGVTLRVSARTGLSGLSERTRAIIAGMAQAAPAAGIAVIDITAGKEGGHLSHANGTEVDLKAYSADGSLWTTSQRVALAAGAQAGGADRFGLYSFGKGKLGSGTMHVGFSGPGRPPAVWGADSKVRGDASRRFTDPAEKAFLASYQAGKPFDIASLGLAPLDPSQAAPQDAQSAIASLIAPTGAPAIPDAPTAAMGFAPTIQDAGFPAPASSIYEGNPFGVGAAPSPAPPPMPQPPPQWAQAGGFPMDEALTGSSAQDVLAGGPRMDPRRAIGSAPVGPTTDQGVLDMGPNLRPPGPQVDMPTPPMRPGNFVFNGGGAPPAPPMPPSNPRRDPFGFPIDVNRPALANGDGSISTEETTTFDAAEVGMPPEIVTVPTIINGRRVSEDEAKAAFASGQNPPVQRGFANYADAEAAAQARTDAIPGARATGSGPFASSFPPRPEGPAAGMPPAPRMGGMSAAMGGPPAPPATSLRTDGGQELLGPGNATGRSRFNNFQTMQDMAARDAQFSSDQQSRLLAGDLGFQRKQMERYVPDYRAPSPQTMGERFDTAAPMPNADQMFGLPPMNGASFPGPDPVVGTAEAGSTTGEWFTPAPPMPAPPPDPMAARFNDAFSPGGPGMIADLQGAFNRQQAPPPPTATAQDGINQIFGAPPAPAAVPNLAIPFAEVPTGPAPPMPSMAPPAPISRSQFDDRFGGGTVVPAPPKPGQPGVVSGEMPSPMDIRPPAQGGPPLPPAPAALPQAAAPAAPRSAPRQPDPGAERQRNSILGRVLGGLLGGPIGALGGGLLGGNGAGFGFGPGASVTGMGPTFSSPYMQSNGKMGSTNVQRVQSGNMQGTMWNRNNGGSVGYVTDPFTGAMIYSSSPSTVGGGGLY